MDYTETEASRMLKKYNDILYETTRKLFKAKNTNVRNSLQQTLSFINKAINEYALKREEEIEEERTQPVTLPGGQIITKGKFIDIQRMYELDDKETANYIKMRLELEGVNIFL